MFALKCNNERFEHTDDIQSIFDITYNSTNNHELAMQACMRAGHMRHNDKGEIVVITDRVILVCYDETTSTVNDKGEIVRKQLRCTPLTVQEIVKQLEHAHLRGLPAKLVAYSKDAWNLYVTYNPSTKNLRYLAEYNYIGGKHGAIEIAVVHGKVLPSSSEVKVPKHIVDKVIQINNKI